MIKFQIIKDNAIFSVEREEFEVERAFDDFLNLLFIAGAEIEDLEKLINLEAFKQKQNHKTDDTKTIKGFSNL